MRSSEKYHLVVSRHVCWRKLMNKRTYAATATRKQGGIERINIVVAHIQCFREYCAICKLLRLPSLAQDLSTPRRARRACEQAEQSQCVGTPQPGPQ